MSGDTVWTSGLGSMKELAKNGDVAAKKIVDGYSGATPLGELASMSTDNPAYESITDFATNGITITKALAGDYLGSIGESSTIALLLGLTFLLLTRNQKRSYGRVNKILLLKYRH